MRFFLEKLLKNHFKIFDINQLTPHQNFLLKNWLKREKEGEPLSKIVNEKFFYESSFYVNQDVLDPRFESEIMIEAILTDYPTKNFISLLELGVGSGCLLLSLMRKYEKSIGIGVDISEKALKVCSFNAKKYRLNPFLVNSSWLSAIFPLFKVDLLISNPPYIAKEEILDKSVLNYDPHCALFANDHGLEAYEIIFSQCQEWVKKGGGFKAGYFEIGYQQQDNVIKIIEKNNFKVENSFKDLLGWTRVLKVSPFL